MGLSRKKIKAKNSEPEYELSGEIRTKFTQCGPIPPRPRHDERCQEKVIGRMPYESECECDDAKVSQGEDNEVTVPGSKYIRVRQEERAMRYELPRSSA